MTINRPGNEQAFQTLLNAGDPILVETPVYAGVVSQCVMHKYDMIGGSLL
jgi:DNA-binding transcriptional MocR family regulator